MLGRDRLRSDLSIGEIINDHIENSAVESLLKRCSVPLAESVTVENLKRRLDCRLQILRLLSNLWLLLLPSPIEVVASPIEKLLETAGVRRDVILEREISDE